MLPLGNACLCVQDNVTSLNAENLPFVMTQAGYHIGLVQHVPLQSFQHLTKIAVLAGAFLLSVVLNNVALKFIPVSFVEVSSSSCKACRQS